MDCKGTGKKGFLPIDLFSRSRSPVQFLVMVGVFPPFLFFFLSLSFLFPMEHFKSLLSQNTESQVSGFRLEISSLVIPPPQNFNKFTALKCYFLGNFLLVVMKLPQQAVLRSLVQLVMVELIFFYSPPPPFFFPLLSQNIKS